MSDITDLDKVRREAGLSQLAQECKDRMRARWPEIDFESALWPLRSMYKTKIEDVNFTHPLNDFNGKDPAYGIAMRCLMATVALKGEVKTASFTINSWRLMSRLDTPLHNLKRMHLTNLEDQVAKEARGNGASANRWLSSLVTLSKQLDWLSKQRAIDRLAWRPSIETKSELNVLRKQSIAMFKDAKVQILDRQIEALSDAMSAMSVVVKQVVA